MRSRGRRVAATWATLTAVALASGCATVAERRAAFGRSHAVDVGAGHSFDVAVRANEELLALDPAELLAAARARCPDLGADAAALRLTLDHGLVRPGSLRGGSFAALAPGAPPGGEAAELPRGVDVAGRLRLQAVVEHRPHGAPRVLAQAVADFSLVGPPARWTPLMRAIAEVAAERARAIVERAARAQAAAR